MGNRISILWADLMMTFPEIESGRVSAGHSNEVSFRITLYTANGKRQFVSRDLSFTAHYKKKHWNWFHASFIHKNRFAQLSFPFNFEKTVKLNLTFAIYRKFKGFKLHVYGKRRTSDSSWEFLKIENEQIHNCLFVVDCRQWAVSEIALESGHPSRRVTLAITHFV